MYQERQHQQLHMLNQQNQMKVQHLMLVVKALQLFIHFFLVYIFQEEIFLYIIMCLRIYQ